MDLTNLDRVSLARLTGHLQTIATAADALAEGGLDPEISLTAEATLLRAAPILSHGAEPPEPVLVDPEDAVVIVPAGPIMGGGGGGCGPAVPDVAPDAFPEFVSPPAAAADDAPAAEDCEASAAGVEDLPPHPPGVPAAAAGGEGGEGQPRPTSRQKSPDGPILGPLTEQERADILRRNEAGESNAEIATALRRRVQSIGLFLAAQEQKGKPKARPRPISEVAQAVVAQVIAARAGVDETEAGPPVADADAAAPGDAGPESRERAEEQARPHQEGPAAGSPPDQILGGDPGGLQRDRLAEDAPVQAGGEDGPVQSPAEAPETGLHGRDRLIWQHIHEIQMPRGWDAELDQELVEGFGHGIKAAQLALDLDVDAKILVARYAALTEVIRDGRGYMTIEGQARLAAMVRRRVQRARAAAA